MKSVSKAKIGLWLIFAFSFLPLACHAVVYLQEDAFVSNSLGQSPEDAKRIWLRGTLKDQVAEILGHPYPALRLKYWQDESRSLWILEEIGKERPITLGVLVGPAGVEQTKILVYRESRGGEVRFPSFLQQFESSQLTPDNELDRSIDGVSGATLSVRAVKRLVRMALFLHSQLGAATSNHGGK